MPSIDYGIQIEPQYGFTYPMILDIASTGETLGFESIWVSDHLFMTTDSIDIPCLECWTTLTALARDTSSLRFGAMVSSQSYRNPALLAKVAATIDHMSAGRLNYGIGAGWKEIEYRAYGYPYPSPATRIRQLDEAVQIAKLMWTEDAPTFHGKYYTIDDVLSSPKPLQKPHIPIWIGGSGNLTLRVTARHGQACNFAWTVPIDLYTQKLAVLQAHCDNEGTNYDAIRKSAGVMMVIGQTDAHVKQKLKKLDALQNTPYMRYLNRQRPNLVGTPDYVAEEMKKYLPLGIDHFILRFHFQDEIDSMTLFMDQVRNQL